MAVHLHQEDLPAEVRFADGPIAVDTEAMGLISAATGSASCRFRTAGGDEHLVPLRRASDYAAPNLKALLADPNRLKLYHFARFDIGDHAGLSRDHGRAALLHARPRRGSCAPTPTATGSRIW